MKNRAKNSFKCNEDFPLDILNVGNISKRTKLSVRREHLRQFMGILPSVQNA